MTPRLVDVPLERRCLAVAQLIQSGRVEPAQRAYCLAWALWPEAADSTCQAILAKPARRSASVRSGQACGRSSR
jgi:hypothetical protein